MDMEEVMELVKQRKVKVGDSVSIQGEKHIVIEMAYRQDSNGFYHYDVTLFNVETKATTMHDAFEWKRSVYP